MREQKWKIDYSIVTTEHGIKFTEPICRCENCGAIATTVKLQCSHCKGQKNDSKEGDNA